MNGEPHPEIFSREKVMRVSLLLPHCDVQKGKKVGGAREKPVHHISDRGGEH